MFDSQLNAILSFQAELRAQGRLRQLDLTDSAWPREPTLVLSEDTALELGHPLDGSIALIVSTQDRGLISDGVDLLGPDLSEMTGPRAPLGQIVMAAGDFADEYECFRALKDAVYGVKLRGVMARAMPSRQEFWYRINRPALSGGLSLAHLGAAFIADLKAIPLVRSARLFFITSAKADLESVSAPARETARIAAAMIRMYEEMNYDCETCEYADVCSEVAELKKIRDRLFPGAIA